MAAEHGLAVADPVVLKDGSNLIVHLRPAPVVARVARLTAQVRRGPAWLIREVQVSGRLAAAGAPAVPPATRPPPGPHISDFQVMSFMAHVEVSAEPVDPEVAARALRACHEALAGGRLDLPPHAVLQEARHLLPGLVADGLIHGDDAEVLERSARHAAGTLAGRGLPLRPVHGDAHLGNALSTPAGVLWNDWEDCFLGPLEWDLACLVARARVLGEDADRAEAALAAYGGRPDPVALDAAVVGRTVQTATWTALFAPGRPELEGRRRAQVAWLREWAV